MRYRLSTSTLFFLASAAALYACQSSGERVLTDEGVGGFLTGVASSGVQSSSADTGPTTSSAGVGGSGNSGGTGGSPSTTAAGGAGGAPNGSGGQGGVPVCNDQGVGEPNDTEVTAHKLSSSKISDCDGNKTITGTLSGKEAEWMTYVGDDEFSLTFQCNVDPTRSFSPTDKGLRLCKFFECLSGNTEFTCPGGTTKTTSPGGRAGCCGSKGFEVSDLNCTGTTDDDANVYIRIDHPQPSDYHCIDWTLNYKY